MPFLEFLKSDSVFDEVHRGGKKMKVNVGRSFILPLSKETRVQSAWVNNTSDGTSEGTSERIWEPYPISPYSGNLIHRSRREVCYNLSLYYTIIRNLDVWSCLRSLVQRIEPKSTIHSSPFVIHPFIHFQMLSLLLAVLQLFGENLRDNPRMLLQALLQTQ